MHSFTHDQLSNTHRNEKTWKEETGRDLRIFLVSRFTVVPIFSPFQRVSLIIPLSGTLRVTAFGLISDDLRIVESKVS